MGDVDKRDEIELPFRMICVFGLGGKLFGLRMIETEGEWRAVY